MASTVKVPLLGTHSKGTVVGVTIGGVTVAGYLIYKKERTAKQSAAAAQAQDTSTQPQDVSSAYTGDGTGYYDMGGSAPGGVPDPYYSYGVSLPPTTPNLPQTSGTNAQWAQAAISQLEQYGYDPQTVAGALGAYEFDRPVTPDQQAIIQAAIGVEGYPPIPGKNGFPPGINVQGTPGGGTGGGQNPPPGGDGGGNGGGHGGPPPITGNTARMVPHVVGERASVGLAKIRAAGFKAKTSPIRNPMRMYEITATHPAGGTMAQIRSLVVVDIRQIR